MTNGVLLGLVPGPLFFIHMNLDVSGKVSKLTDDVQVSRVAGR